MESIFFKRQIIFLLMVIFLSLVSIETLLAKNKSDLVNRFRIKISCGLNNLRNIRDINKHLSTGNERHSDYAQYYNGLKKGELKEIGSGFESEIGLTFDITSRLNVYIRSGYEFTEIQSASGFEISPPGLIDVDFTYSPDISIRTIPIKLGISYIIPFSRKTRLFINGGIGYYLVKTNFNWKQTEIWTYKDGSLYADFSEMVEWDLNSKPIGYHGGVGLEYSIARNLGLVFEIQANSVKAKKLKGTELFLGPGSSESLYGTVYYFEKWNSITEKYYMGLGFFKEKPDYLPSPEYRNIRNAELDLSGYILKIGIKIRLY